MESATERLPHLLNLPPDGPAVIQLDRGGPVVLPVGPAKDGFRMATVPKGEPAVVRLRLKSADPDHPLEPGEVRWGDDLRGEEEEGEVGEDGLWTLRTYRRGRRVVETAYMREFQERTIEVSIPPDARLVDLGAVVVHPLKQRTLRVVGSDGAVVRDLSLHWGVYGEHGNELQEDDGSFSLELGPAVTLALLRGQGIYPTPLRLNADGPTEVRLPGGRVVIRVQGGEGRALKSVAYVDHVRVALDGREHSLGAVPAGTHTVIVGAEGHTGCVRTDPPEGRPDPHAGVPALPTVR